MELEELKTAWAEYDKKLAENLKINEELLKRMNLDKSKSELSKLMPWEISGIVVAFLAFFSMAFCAVYMMAVGETLFAVLALAVVIISLIFLLLGYVRIKAFLKIDYYHTPVVQLQHQIASLKLLILKFRKTEFILTILFVLFLFPTLFKWIHDINLFHINYFVWDPIIRLVFIFACIIPLAIWTDKYIYDKRIANAQYHLDEIERFSREDTASNSTVEADGKII